MAKEKPIGKVVHWYDNIKVAVVKLSANIKIGDKIKVKKGEEEFEDSIVSIQLDHEAIKSGKKGQEVAIKLSKEAKENSEIYPA